MKRAMKLGCICLSALALLLVIAGVAFIVFINREMTYSQAEMSEYHPFRSAEAKGRYLNLYDERAKNWPVVSESKTVETSYGRTFVRISGPAGSPPLVLLHGIGSNSLQWIFNIEALSERHQTYAVDNIYDNGRSVYTKPIESPDDFVNWLDELFTALGLEDDINLVGLSYGGWLTSQYALRFPNRLDKIVILAPVCTVLPLPAEWIVRAALSMLSHPYFVRSLLFWMAEDLAREEAGRIIVEEWADDAFVAIRCFKPKRMVNPTVLDDEELRGIKVPTLYLVGENEKIYAAHKAIERLNAVAPEIMTEVIPDAGHDLTFVQADLVNRKILEFLDLTR